MQFVINDTFSYRTFYSYPNLEVIMDMLDMVKCDASWLKYFHLLQHINKQTFMWVLGHQYSNPF